MNVGRWSESAGASYMYVCRLSVRVIGVSAKVA